MSNYNKIIKTWTVLYFMTKFVPGSPVLTVFTLATGCPIFRNIPKGRWGRWASPPLLYQANSGGSWNIPREIVLGQFVDYKLAPCKLIQCFTPRAHVGVHVVPSPPTLGKPAWWSQRFVQLDLARWWATTNKKLIPSRTRLSDIQLNLPKNFQ